MTPDMINGIFELFGGMFLILNCRRIYLDKELKGVSILPVIFFTSWGYWNMFFYPSMGAWYSFYGGMFIAITNTVWLALVIYYKAHKPSSPKDAVKGDSENRRTTDHMSPVPTGESCKTIFVQ